LLICLSIHNSPAKFVHLNTKISQVIAWDFAFVAYCIDPIMSITSKYYLVVKVDG